MSRSTILLVIGTFVASVAGGVAIAAGVSGDDDGESAAPEPVVTIPVLEPVASLPLPADGSGTVDTSQIPGGASKIVSEVDLVPGPSASGGGPPAGATPASGGPLTLDSMEAPTALDEDDLLPRLIDPCAGAVPGAPVPDGCDDGTGSTVLALIPGAESDVIVPPPFDIFEVFELTHPVVTGERSALRCGTAGRARSFVVVSNRPADFVASWTVLAPDGISPGGPVLGTVEVSTAPHEVGRYRTLAGSGALPSDDVNIWPQTCFDLPALPVGTYYVSVEGTTGAQSDTGATTLTVTDRGRPDVTVTPDGIHRLHISAPVEESVQVFYISRREAATVECRAAEADEAFSRGRREATDRDATPIDGIDGADYPYDPAYTHRAEFRTERLDPGSQYAICVWWFDEAGAVVEREVRDVSTPVRWLFGLSASDVQFRTPHRPDEVTVLGFFRADDFADPRCAFQLAGAEPVREATFEHEGPGFGLGICFTPPDNTERGIIDTGGGEVALGVAFSWEGRRVSYLLPLGSASPCTAGVKPDCAASHAEFFRLALPARVRGLCGSGLGACDPCEREGTCPGTVLLRVDFVVPSATGGSPEVMSNDWVIGGPSPG